MGDIASSNGNGQISAAVLQTVLDKFLTLTEQNSQASSGMSNAIETMAANITEMTEHLSVLERQITEENLGSVLTESVAKVKTCIDSLKESMSGCAINQLGFLAEVCQHLEYQNQNPKVVAESLMKTLMDESEYQDDLKWALGVVGWVRQHVLIISFLAGGLAIWLYLKAGVDTIGYIKAWIGG